MSIDHVEGYISALKKQLGITRDDELSARLGVAKSTVSSWRKRGQVPKAIAAKAEAEFGVSYQRIFEAYQFTKNLRDSYVRQAYLMALCRMSAIVGGRGMALELMVSWMAESESSICDVLGIGKSLVETTLGLAEAKALYDRVNTDDAALVNKLWEQWQNEQERLLGIK